jgi:hypothetical protein
MYLQRPFLLNPFTDRRGICAVGRFEERERTAFTVCTANFGLWSIWQVLKSLLLLVLVKRLCKFSTNFGNKSQIAVHLSPSRSCNRQFTILHEIWVAEGCENIDVGLVGSSAVCNCKEILFLVLKMERVYPCETLVPTHNSTRRYYTAEQHRYCFLCYSKMYQF